MAVDMHSYGTTGGFSSHAPYEQGGVPTDWRHWPMSGENLSGK